MTEEARGRYRILGKTGQPNMAFLEIGRIGMEITEQEYRDRGYEPDFDELPLKINYCPVDEKNPHEQQ